MDYLQPTFYHFSEDSIILAELARNEVAKNCLDLGSGCGVVGIELSNKNKHIEQITFLEIQKEYEEFLYQNCTNLLPKDVHFSIVIEGFKNFHTNEQFDLIIGNLPYFIKEASRPSPNYNKDICRRWIKDSIEDVIRILEASLAKSGKAFLIVDETLINNFNSFYIKVVKKLKTVVIISVSKEI